MKRSLPFTLACLLLAAGCGRQESVDELPSSEELANAANAAIEKDSASLKGADTQQPRIYANAAHGFSITPPEGWVRDEKASGPTGAVYRDPGAGADIRIFWSQNADDRDLHQIVRAMTDGSEAVDGDFLGEGEYRGTANDGEGNNVAVRLLRKADGSLVTATFVYPEMLGEQYSAVAEQTLSSLEITDAAPPAEADSTENTTADVR